MLDHGDTGATGRQYETYSRPLPSRLGVAPPSSRTSSQAVVPKQSETGPAPMREPRLFVTDAECAKRVGVPLDDWKYAAAILTNQGLPLPDPLFKNRRYWPAVRAFLDWRYRIGPAFGPRFPWKKSDDDVMSADDPGVENWDAPRPRKKRRRGF